MSTLVQPKYPTSSTHQVGRSHLLLHRAGVYYAAAATTKPRPNAKLVVMASRLEPPQMVVTTTGNDPSLQSPWSHRAWVAAVCTTVAITVAEYIKGAAHLHMWFEPILAACVGYILADLASGVYHWGIDNYRNGKAPIFGSQIKAFQAHHKSPWTITRRQFAYNLHALARARTFTVLPLVLVCHYHVVQTFVGVCSGCIMFSQQFHVWAHGKNSRLPPLAVALQEARVLVSWSELAV